MDQTSVLETNVESSPRGRRHESPTRISINTSPAKQTSLIPSPKSPAKSITGAIVEGSHAKLFTSASQRLAEEDFAPVSPFELPPRHPDHNYTSPEVRNENLPDLFQTPNRSFFNSDSSDLESPLGNPLQLFQERPDQPSKLRIKTERNAWGAFTTQDSPRDIEADLLNQAALANTDDWFADSSNIHLNQERLDPISYGSVVDEIGRDALPSARPSSDIFVNHQNIWTRPFTSLNTPGDPSDDVVVGDTAKHILDAHGMAERAIISHDLNFMPGQVAQSHAPDRIVDGYRMFLQAVLQEEKNRQARSPLDIDTMSFDNNFSKFDNAQALYSPIRPMRPHLETDSFIATASAEGLANQSYVSNNPALNLKLPPLPPIPRIPETTKSTIGQRRSASLPPTSGPAAAATRQVQLMIPSGRTDGVSTFKAPEIHTPYPFPRPTPILTSPKDTRPSQPTSPRRSISVHRLSRGRSPSHKRRSNPYSVHGQPISSSTAGPTRDTHLELFVRRRHGRHGRRIATVTIPRDSGIAPMATRVRAANGQNEAHFASLDYDDAVLMSRLRGAYYGTLMGDEWMARTWRRWASARCLQRITLATDDGHGAALGAGVNEPLPETQLLLLFRKPAVGAGAYSWIRWAHRIAGMDSRADDGNGVGVALSSPTMALSPEQPQEQPQSHLRTVSGSTLSSRKERAPVRLEFVEGWCVWRILLGVVAAVLAAVAVCLLWILVGPDVEVGSNLKNVDIVLGGRVERVSTALVMAVVVLLLGWTGVGAWVWASWILM